MTPIRDGAVSPASSRSLRLQEFQKFRALWGRFPRRMRGACGLVAFALLACGGCGGKTPPPTAAEEQFPVRVLVLDDEPLAAAIREQWAARGEGELEVSTQSSAEALEGGRRLNDTDLVVYPARLLGQLSAAEMILPLDLEVRTDENLALIEVFELTRLREIAWGRDTYAAPLGSPQLMLLYRRDIFERLRLQAPETWEQYDRVAAQLAEASPTDGAPTDVSPADVSPADAGDGTAAEGAAASASWLGACEPGGGSWPAMTWLARAATYAADPNQTDMLFDLNTMAPKIASPPFVRALQQWRAARVDRGRPSPVDCYRALLAGRCGMALCWPTAAIRDLPHGQPIGCARLPGSREFYRGGEWEPVEGADPLRVPLLGVSGRFISICRDARRRSQAQHRLVWLAGREWGGEVSKASLATGPVRSSHLASLATWAPGLDEAGREAYARVVEANQARQIALFAVRIPAAAAYVQALQDAVAPQDGGAAAPPVDALSRAAREWEQITDREGRRTQSRAYAASLGL